MELTKWHDVKMNVTEIVLAERETWETVDAGDYAHEFADSYDAVIYYYKARELWADSSEVREYEETALECIDIDATVCIDQILCAVVYWAVRDLVLTVISEHATVTA